MTETFPIKVSPKSLEEKIKKMLHEYYHSSGCNPLFAECEQEVLAEIHALHEKIREKAKIVKIIRDSHGSWRMEAEDIAKFAKLEPDSSKQVSFITLNEVLALLPSGKVHQKESSV